MVFQKKGGFKGKQQTPAKQKGRNSMQKPMNSGMDSFFDQGSDDSENEQIATPGAKTPKGKQAQADKRVSFQIPGKNTPKTPKNENSLVKKQPTPGKQSALKEFKGLQQNNSAKKNNKQSKKSADDDDDEDDDDDDDDDDIDLDMLGDDDDDDDDDEEDSEDEEEKPKKMQQKQNNSQMKQKSSKKSEDDDDDDDEDDDDEMDMDMLMGDDDDDDDDSEDDSDEEKPQQKKQKNQMNNSQQKPVQENKTPLKKEKSPVKKDQKTPQTSTQSMASLKKKVENPADPKLMVLAEDRKKERDIRTLYVGNLPLDVLPSELKALSNDILSVNIPQLKNKKRSKNLFAFLEFLNEAKAEENFKLLKSKKLRGQLLNIDFTGCKRQNNVQTEEKPVNLKKLFISSISDDTTIDKIAALFPKSFQITLNVTAAYRSATALFHTEKEAAEALEKCKNIKLEGKPLTVLYSVSKDRTTKRKRSKKSHKNAAAKKMKMETKKESDDDDDDDDEDDEE